ncbi:MAG TPA: DUF6544 family protein [Saprospiraceae bacterium]|nr:DUF6544 family protein [Saprospiraceae bacterium]
MRYLFIFLILAHGLIHLLGFVKAFKLAEISQLTQPISRNSGLLWLLATCLLITTALLFSMASNVWWIPATAGIILSQILIFNTWHDAKFGTIANVLILLGVVFGAGSWYFSRMYRQDVQTGLTLANQRSPDLFTEADLAPLPEPVQRYLRYSGVLGQPKISHFKVCFSGQLRKNEQSEWMPFQSEQFNFMEPATRLFFMKAEMKKLPVDGYHKFVDGDAFMDIRLLSLFRVQYQHGPEMDTAETVTFFNDMCCMAPATLIDSRIKWLETDGNKVKATFTNHGITISAWLYFNEEGQLVNFLSDDRYATGDDQVMRKIPWSTPLRHYKTIQGNQLPGYAEAIYHYPEGNLVYGTFQLTGLAYNPTHY